MACDIASRIRVKRDRKCHYQPDYGTVGEEPSCSRRMNTQRCSSWLAVMRSVACLRLLSVELSLFRAPSSVRPPQPRRLFITLRFLHILSHVRGIKMSIFNYFNKYSTYVNFYNNNIDATLKYQYFYYCKNTIEHAFRFNDLKKVTRCWMTGVCDGLSFKLRVSTEKYIRIKNIGNFYGKPAPLKMSCCALMFYSVAALERL